MDTESKRIGSCLCGAVQITVDTSKTDLGVCHCHKCRKWSGGPFFEVECGNAVSFEGLENVAVYESSNWAQRGFCKICGTHLFVKSSSTGEYGIPPGLFVSESGIQFNRQVFIDHKPGYYNFENKTMNITSDYIHENFPETKEKA